MPASPAFRVTSYGASSTVTGRRRGAPNPWQRGPRAYVRYVKECDEGTTHFVGTRKGAAMKATWHNKVLTVSRNWCLPVPRNPEPATLWAR